MAYKKPEPIPVMVQNDRFHSEGKLHKKVNGLWIVELVTPARGGKFVTVAPHDVKMIDHLAPIFVQEQEQVAA